MKPTPKLRFIERTVEVHGDPKTVRILQQWWCHTRDVLGHEFELIGGEWRDVPLETE